jgi:hypothetical protein
MAVGMGPPPVAQAVRCRDRRALRTSSCEIPQCRAIDRLPLARHSYRWRQGDKTVISREESSCRVEHNVMRRRKQSGVGSEGG